MLSTLEETVALLYNHVRIVTKINKSQDVHSPFVEDLPTRVLTYTGYMKAIDPISRSIVLCLIDGDVVNNNLLILGHVIDRIEPSGLTDTIPNQTVQQLIEAYNTPRLSKHSFFERDKLPSSYSVDEIIYKRDKILSWLTKLRIPNELDVPTYDIIVADDVRIKPPYEHISDFVCPTRIVLKRVKHIIETASMRIDTT